MVVVLDVGYERLLLLCVPSVQGNSTLTGMTQDIVCVWKPSHGKGVLVLVRRFSTGIGP